MTPTPWIKYTADDPKHEKAAEIMTKLVNFQQDRELKETLLRLRKRSPNFAAIYEELLKANGVEVERIMRLESK